MILVLLLRKDVISLVCVFYFIVYWDFHLYIKYETTYWESDSQQHKQNLRWLFFFFSLFLTAVHLDKRIVLRTFNYEHREPRYKYSIITNICGGTFKMMSTDVSNTNDHCFQSHNNIIEFYMPRYMERQVIQSSSNIPFRNINYLVIHLSLMESQIISLLNNVFTLSE